MTARLYDIARRRAIHAVERSAHLRLVRPTLTPPRQLPASEGPRAPTRAELLVLGIVWLIFLAIGIWLARHDPDTLSQLTARVLGEPPA